eukprot:scpid13509/ scgid23933/ Chromodomain-helicase-DNA-binding protein 5; ATP-dependent helicase CHD5
MQKDSVVEEDSVAQDTAGKSVSRKRKRPQRYVDNDGESDEAGSNPDSLSINSPVDTKGANGTTASGHARSRSVSPAVAKGATTNGGTEASDSDSADRELPDEALRATSQPDFARIVKPWLAKTVAGLEGRQLDDAVAERWGQVTAQRLDRSSTASSRPSRASREKAIRDIAIGAEFEKASSRKRFYEEEDYSAPERKKRLPKPKAVTDLRAKERSRTKAKQASESEMSMGSESESDQDTQSPAPKRKSKRKAVKIKETSVESSRGGTDQSASPSEAEAEVEESEDDYDEFCKVCREGGDLLCCDNCPCTYHMTCLNPPLKSVPEETWVCPRCLAEPLKGKIARVLTWKWFDPPLLPLTDEEVAAGVQPHAAPGAKPIRQFLVRYKDFSFWDCEWISELQMEVHEIHQFRSCSQKYRRVNLWATPPGPQDPDNVVKGDTLEADLLNSGVAADFLIPQRIVKHRDGEEGDRNYLVKWRELTYDNCSWERLDVHSDMPRLLDKYNDIRALNDPTYKKKDKKKKEKQLSHSKSVKICSTKYEEQPDFLTGTLHPYQLEGLNWLRFSWAQGTNTILADEMGLGKTIQTIAFLSSLVKEGHCQGPFLVSAPLSTLINWEREFEFWAPDLYAVTYCGPQEARRVLRETEVSFDEDAVKNSSKLYKIKAGSNIKFHVLLTSFEMVTLDKTLLQSIDWEVLVIDEAHRLKNNKSQYFRIMSAYHIKYKLLLTGTPLQNTLEELFHLLNFLSPAEFYDMNNFLTEFQDVSKEEQVIKLHDLLGPHLLRRLKADVLKTMPTKTELIVRVDLAPIQKTVYRSILTRNFEALNSRRSTAGGNQVTLLNVMMDLKKCCNHPYLFPGPSEEAPRTKVGNFEGRALVEACGKFSLLEKMLIRLKKNGHRVLIFSQMTRVLDLLEDFLEYKEYNYERIDGGISGASRQLAIDRFNAPGASGFVFLLSTRAGGLGINLATADTVIIYDSDWNPHNDIQALSRAHRIGQQNTVMIYRFVTRSSVEERVTEVAKRKMMLTHMVVRPGLGGKSQAQFTKKEMDDILRFGTQQLFEDDNEKDGNKDEADGASKDTGRIVYDDEMLDKLLDRTQQSNVGEMKDGLNEYFSAFKVASFAIKEAEEPQPEVEVVKQDDDTQIDTNYWERLLRHHFDHMVEEEQGQLSEMGKGKRQRKQVNYMDSGYQESSYDRHAKNEDPDASFSNEESSNEEDEDSQEKATGPRKRGRKAAAAAARLQAEVAPVPPLLALVDKQLEVLGFTTRQRKAFHTAVMRFGLPHTMNFDWLPTLIRKRKPVAHIRMYMNMYMRHLCEPSNSREPTYSDGVPKDSLNTDLVLNRIGIMKLIRQKVLSYKSTNGTSSKGESLPVAAAAAAVKPGVASALTPAASATSSSTSVSDKSTASSTAATTTVGPGQPRPASDANTSAMAGTSTEPAVNGDSNPVLDKAKEAPKFMFNIADGGFTELHARWAKERSGPGSELPVTALLADEVDALVEPVWGRRHDYWLLHGIVEHGYARWPDIIADPNLSILGDALHSVAYENKVRYLNRRLKLLEQALLIEEQLKKAHAQALVQDPKHSVMTLNSKFAELEALVESNQYLVQPALVKNKAANRVLANALAQMDDLLGELRSEVNRLPHLLATLPSISQRLGLSQEAIIRQAITPRPVPVATSQHAPVATAAAAAATITVGGKPPQLVPISSGSSTVTSASSRLTRVGLGNTADASVTAKPLHQQKPPPAHVASAVNSAAAYQKHSTVPPVSSVTSLVDSSSSKSATSASTPRLAYAITGASIAAVPVVKHTLPPQPAAPLSGSAVPTVSASTHLNRPAVAAA